MPHAAPLVARRRGLAGRDVEVHAEGGPVARVTLAALSDTATIALGGAEFLIEKETMRRHYRLTFEGVDLAKADGTMGLRRTFEVVVRAELLGQPEARYLTLRAGGWTGSRFDLSEGGEPLGHLAKKGVFRSRTEMHLPPDVPLLVQTFLLALALMAWRQNQQAASA